MIQRIQSLYMAIAAVVSGILPFVLPLWKQGDQDYYFMQNLTYVTLFGISFVLALFAIFGYKKRQNQFVLNRLNLLINLILLGLFVYRSLTISGEEQSSEKGIGIFLPIVTVVCLALANRAIKKDEELVKSVDRLR